MDLEACCKSQKTVLALKFEWLVEQSIKLSHRQSLSTIAIQGFLNLKIVNFLKLVQMILSCMFEYHAKMSFWDTEGTPSAMWLSYIHKTVFPAAL